MSSNKAFLVIPLPSFYLRLWYFALLFIDTEVILFPKNSPLSRSSPDFGNPSPIEIDAVKGVGWWVSATLVLLGAIQNQ